MSTAMSLDTTLDDSVLSVTLNRPERYNAIDPELRDLLVDAFETAAERGARAIMVRGHGRGFCAGADLKAEAAEYYGIEVEQHMTRSTYRIARAVINCRVPVVAAVHGACAGIGLTIALGADLCIAAEGARFVGAFIQRSLVPDAAAARLLPRIIGYSRAREFLLLGQTIEADEALALNMVSQVVSVDDLVTVANTAAREFAAMPTVAIGYTKQLLNRSFELDLESFLFEERMIQAMLSTTTDKAEGLTAFREQRSPRFEGR
jgi:2-(1,2-epoxy-1,2-dihydrophenyl)acetyl-CoA isomerase